MIRIRNRLGLGCRITLFMTLIFFLICFIHSIIRNMKDALVITAEGSATEVIPFIQIWMMLPATLFVTWAFTRLASRYNQITLFYVVVGSFLGFFALFALVLYPLRDVLHPQAFANDTLIWMPSGLHGMVGMIRNWTFSAFYTVGELWASTVTAVLFWGFANTISSLSSARRSYGVYMMGGNLGATLAGLVPLAAGDLSVEMSVYGLMAVVLAMGLGMLVLFHRMTTQILVGSEYDVIRHEANARDRSKKDGLIEALASIFRSPYLLSIGIIVLGYNLVLNVGELVWKDQLKHVFSDFSSYNRYLGYITIVIGIGSIVVASMFPRILARLGWTKTAMICPISLLVTGFAFLTALYLTDFFPTHASILLTIGVLLGGLMEIVARVTKHSVLDGTKDMAFIPVDPAIKLKSKAAIDGGLSRLGRCASAGFHQVFIIMFTTISNSIPMVGLVLLTSLVVWIGAVKYLGIQFGKFSDQADGDNEKNISDAVRAAA